MDPVIRCLNCNSDKVKHWCDATDVEYHTTDKVFAYYFCSDCENLFIDPCWSDKLSLIYPSTYYSFEGGGSADGGGSAVSLAGRVKSYLDKSYFRRILQRVKGDRLRVLDIGGGRGWMLDVVKSVDPRVVETQVVDFDEKAMEHARARGHGYFLGKIEDFPAGSGEKFDFILMLNLIEHLRNPGEVLSKVRELLSDNGVLLIKTPNYDSLDERLFRRSSWLGYHCPRHFVLFKRETLVRALESNGFRVIRASYTQGAPFWAGSVIAFLQKKGLLRRRMDRPINSHPLISFLMIFFAAFDFIRRPFSKTSQMFVEARRS